MSKVAIFGSILGTIAILACIVAVAWAIMKNITWRPGISLWTKFKPWFKGSVMVIVGGTLAFCLFLMFLYYTILPSGKGVWVDVFRPNLWTLLVFVGALVVIDWLRGYKAFPVFLLQLMAIALIVNLLIAMIWQPIVMARWGDTIRPIFTKEDWHLASVTSAKVEKPLYKERDKAEQKTTAHTAPHTHYQIRPSLQPSGKEEKKFEVVVNNDNKWTTPLDVKNIPYHLDVDACVDELANGSILHHICPNDSNMDIGRVRTLQFKNDSEIVATVYMVYYPKPKAEVASKQ